MRHFKKYILVLLFTLLLISCKKKSADEYVQPVENIPENRITASWDVPAHFPAMEIPANNPMSEQAVLLGKKLFFDPVLSGNDKISCASCHRQEDSFTDGVAFSNIGISGNLLHRNSPTLANIGYATNGLFWDGGATNLESLIIGPITHLDEMGQNVLDIPTELEAKENYKELFAQAFPKEANAITIQKVLKAIAQYLRTLNSYNSRYDKYIASPDKNPLSSEELKGLSVFDQKCASCHDRSKHLFSDHLFHNIGLDSIYSIENERVAFGRKRITEKEEDLGKFKTPTLRNSAFTAPYMHDGRFATIDQVLDHFETGIVPQKTLDVAFQNGYTITKEEKKVLKAFLNTLNDENFVTNPKLVFSQLVN